MLSHQEPSFGETPNKTTIFVVEFREKNGVPQSPEPFSEVGIKAPIAFSRPEKGNG